MHFPIVTVIVPVYNIASCLPQCLNSLVSQTLTEIEILCVDDASTDESARVVEHFQERDSRIQLLRQPHKGVSSARNLGISQASGKYITFVDGDDWVEPDMLETMVKVAEETACDVVTCSAKVHIEQHTAHSIRRHNSLQAALTVTEGIWEAEGTPRCVWELVKRPGSWPFVWNKLIRRDLLQAHLIDFSPSLSLGEDGVFLQLLFQYTKKVAFVSRALYHYRYQRKSSATDKLFQNQAIRFQQHMDIVAEMLCAFNERGLLDDHGPYLLQWILSFLYADFVGIPAVNRQRVSVTIHDLLSRYDLVSRSGVLTRLEQKRLQNMLATAKPCTETKRIADMVRLKVENRVIRIFSRHLL